jgi:hypothetical protein
MGGGRVTELEAGAVRCGVAMQFPVKLLKKKCFAPAHDLFPDGFRGL